MRFGFQWDKTFIFNNFKPKKFLLLEMKNCEDESKKAEENNFEDVLSLVGSNGKYQKIFLYAILGPNLLLFGFFLMNIIFMVYIPEHHCYVEGRETSNMSVEEWKKFTIPREIGPDGQERWSKCLMYNPTNKSEKYKCLNGWVYDKSDYEKTIATEFDWVCDKSDYATNILTIGSVGSGIGAFIFGRLADRIGKKTMFFLAMLIQGVTRFITLFIPNYYIIFLIVELIHGTAFPIYFLLPKTLITEICDVEYRSWVYSICYILVVSGCCLLPLIVWVVRDWFWIGLITSAPTILLFLQYKYIEESPRWLTSMGRIDEAKSVILKIAKINGNEKKINEDDLENRLKFIYDKEEKSKNSKSFKVLFQKRRLGKNTMLISVARSANYIIYNGLILNSLYMTGNQFLNFFLIMIMEIPAYIFGGWLAEKMGRRWSQVVFNAIIGFLIVVCMVGITIQSMTLATTIGVLVAKFAVCVVEIILGIQTEEIFPTILRSTGVGFAATASSISEVAVPYIIYFGNTFALGPYIIMGILAIIGAIVTAFIPETNKQNLPQTAEEANNFGKSDKFWSFNKEV